LPLCLLGCGGSSKSSSQPPPVIATATLPAATVGAAYSQTMAATGGVQPLTWSISSGNLPAGLNLDLLDSFEWANSGIHNAEFHCGNHLYCFARKSLRAWSRKCWA